jgi:RimJ/RimL family protein N-acetyltransferase
LRIRTKRLSLESVTVADASLVLSGRRDSNWAVDYPTEGDILIARLVIDRPDVANAALGPMKVILADSSLVVGGCGFLGPPDDKGAVEIGYGLAPSHRGQGIATEAVAALVRTAFASPGVRVVWASIQEADLVSQAVLRRNGFAFVSTDDGHHRYEVGRHRAE